MYLCFRDSGSAREGFVHSTVTRKTGKKHYATALSFNDSGLPASLLLISQYPFFTLQKDCLGRILAAARKDDAYTIEFYLSLLFHHLMFNPKLKNLIEVGSFGLLEDKPQILFKYSNCKEDCFSLSNHPVKDMCGLISQENLFKLLSLILLERKVVLIKDDDRDIAVAIEWLLSLTFPL
eukprot:TRINITY_DN9568_c0_g1_i1.p2 TRINITY_DN9568_c0_g1~~TRINITY_DN9568_c0_g1_i1.p2  ORF type:complete len:179 (-),score=45.84 TRINITY_DN9568_c0_g1_i1:306-842(-)